jgi:DNA adenine methylase
MDVTATKSKTRRPEKARAGRSGRASDLFEELIIDSFAGGGGVRGHGRASSSGAEGSGGMSALAVPKITAIAPWFGGKRTLAPVIVQELGKHSVYFEPMCGGFSVLLNKPESRMEVVNDLHGDIINLALVIQHQRFGPMLYRRARRLLVSDDQLAQADALIRNSDPGDAIDLERAWAFFITSWMGRNGEVGLKKNERGRSLAARWNANGGDPATRFNSAVLSIPAWRKRLRHVTILRRDAFKVIERIDDVAGTSIYVDPPYLQKSDQYLHDFEVADGGLIEDDHARLSRLLSRFAKARVVVSYYQHPRLAHLYPIDRWTHRSCAINKGIHNAGRRGSGATKAPEVLLINGPSFARAA